MNAWLATIVGEGAAPIVGFILLFILVIALLLLVFAILRRVTGGTFVAGGRNRQVRLSVTTRQLSTIAGGWYSCAATTSSI